MSGFDASAGQRPDLDLSSLVPTRTRAGRWWLDLPLARKGALLTVVPMVVVVTVLVTAFAFQRRTTQVRAELDEATVTIVEASTLAETMIAAQSSVRAYAATGDEAMLEQSQVAIDALPGPVRQLRVDAPEVYRDDIESVTVLSEQAIAALALARDQLVDGVAADVALAPATQAIGEWRGGINGVRFGLLGDIDDQVAQQERWEDLTRTTLIGGLLALVVTTGLAGYVIASSLVGRTVRLADNVQRFWAGEPVLPSRQAGDELGHLTRTVATVGLLFVDQQAQLVESRDQALAATRAKDEFLSRTSHELRTPLTAIIGFGQLMQMDDEHLSDDDRDSVDRIVHAGRHLLALINDILDIGKIEAGQLAISLEAVSVTDMIRETTSLVEAQAAERSITVTTAPTDGIYVRADPQRIEQVLLNLLSNAIKFNHPGGRIHLDCEEVGHRDDPVAGAGERVRLSVADTGSGIAPDDLDRLFEPFERLGAFADGIEGTGVGLALSKDLVRAMGGTIGVDSAPGSGSTFWFELARAEPVDEPVPGAAVPRQVGSPPSGPATVVLYIEDDRANMQFMTRLFRDRPERLELAMRGRQGLDLASEMHPDLVLLDLDLPDMHGTELLRSLKSDPATADIPVVVVSADATLPTRDRIFGEGAVDYLAKPVEVTELLAILDRLPDGLEAHAAGARHDPPSAPSPTEA